MRVLAVAVRELRVVVPPGVLRAHDLVEHDLHVVKESRLPLVDEEREGRMKRRKENEALLDVVALQEVRYLRSHVVKLETLVRDDPEGLGDDPQRLKTGIGG